MSDEEKRAWITLILKQHFFENEYYLEVAIVDLMLLIHEAEQTAVGEYCRGLEP